MDKLAILFVCLFVFNQKSIHSFINDSMCHSCTEWSRSRGVILGSRSNLIPAFEQSPVIVRPGVPANSTNPATFGGKISRPPRGLPHMSDVTCAFTWGSCINNVACVTQLIMCKRFNTNRAGKYPVAMAIGGVRHSNSLCKQNRKKRCPHIENHYFKYSSFAWATQRHL